MCTEADDPMALREMILTLADGKYPLKEIGERGRTYILENMTARVATAKWLVLLETLGHSGTRLWENLIEGDKKWKRTRRFMWRVIGDW